MILLVFLKSSDGNSVVEAAVFFPLLVALFLVGVDLIRVLDMHDLSSEMAEAGITIQNVRDITSEEKAALLFSDTDIGSNNGNVKLAFQMQTLLVDYEGNVKVIGAEEAGQSDVRCYIDVTGADLVHQIEDFIFGTYVVSKACVKSEQGYFLSPFLSDLLVENQTIRQIKDPAFQ